MRAPHFIRLAGILLLAVFSAACEGSKAPSGTEIGSSGPTENSITGDPVAPRTGSATLSWQPPAERLDGSPLLNLAGYRILYGQESGRYSYTIEIDNTGITRYFIGDLGEGAWFFAVVAIDTEGLESPPSAEVSKHI